MNNRTRRTEPPSPHTRGHIAAAAAAASATAAAQAAAAQDANAMRGHLSRRLAAAHSYPVDDSKRHDAQTFDNPSEIVIRRYGQIEICDPPSPMQEEPEEPTEERQEAEKEKRRLTEAFRLYHANHGVMPDHTEELVETVRASLRAKVNNLADDNWMFEAEEQPRV